MNMADSEKIAQKLESLGLKSAPEKAADLVIVNACSVRQSAVDRVWGKIRLWQEAKKTILITGCVLNTDRKKLARKKIIFFNINNLDGLNKILNHHYHTAKLRSETSNVNINNRISYIPIMTGCDNFCSYCAVPYTRGREISRSIKAIISDVENAIKNGSKNILLLGQNANSYKTKSLNNSRSSAKNLRIDNSDFIILLKTIDKLPFDFKFNFLSSNPHDMSDELIDCFGKLKKWPQEFHLPLQSGDDEILRRMNRKYNSKQYLELIKKLRKAIGDNLKISTDIIVGFPGETEKQFENTVKICKQVNFTKAYIAQYSPRPGTAAAKLTDDVPKAEKKRRWLVLEQLINH